MNVTGAAQTTGAASDTGSGFFDRINSDKEVFLKLLITQLRNQDPLSPMEDREFVTQLAQFTSLESLQSINARLEENQAISMIQQAASLVGKNVTVLDPYGDAADGVVEGKVTAVRLLGGSGPSMTIEGKDYPLGFLISVKE